MYLVCPEFVAVDGDEAVCELLITEQSGEDRHHVDLVIVPPEAVLGMAD